MIGLSTFHFAALAVRNPLTDSFSCEALPSLRHGENMKINVREKLHFDSRRMSSPAPLQDRRPSD